jgi:hypothetical protein
MTVFICSEVSFGVEIKFNREYYPGLRYSSCINLFG